MKLKMLKWIFGRSKSRTQNLPQQCLTELDGDGNNNESNSNKEDQRQGPHLIKNSKCSGRKPSTKLKSFPPSPENVIKSNKGYVSESNYPTDSGGKLADQVSHAENRRPTNNNVSAMVYMAGSQRGSPFKPRATLGSSEPFPFEIPTDPVPRKSLFYDISYGVDAQQAFQEEVQLQKSPRNSTVPRVSEIKRVSEIPRVSQIRHVSEVPRGSQIRRVSEVRQVSKIPPGYLARSSVVQEPQTVRPPSNDQSVQKTIVKVRPYSISNYNENSNVRRLPMKPPKRSSAKISVDGKVLHPVSKDKIRNSMNIDRDVQPAAMIVQFGNNCLQSEELVDQIPTTDPGFSTQEPESNLESNVKEEVHQNTEEDNDSAGSGEHKTTEYVQVFPYKQDGDEPMVYAVPTTTKKARKSILQSVFPSRGRTSSILETSVKSLTSKNQNEPVINRKNIRQSMDTDVFAANVHTRGAQIPPPPTYVTMERGSKPLLVSDVLNPITSLFISDLKDPVPKDPLRKPKETNKWVKARSPPVSQRQSFNRQPKPPVQVYQEPVSKRQMPPTQQHSSRYTNQCSESSSDESIIVYRKKSRPSTYRKSYHKHAVYAAQTPEMMLPHYTTAEEDILKVQSDEKLPVYPSKQTSSDFCGLEIYQEKYKNQNNVSGIKLISDDIADFGNEMDLICYPSEKMLNSNLPESESTSKLRWRIIIKRGED